MKPPYVSLENAEAVNRYYAKVEPNKALMRVFHFVMGRAFVGTTYFEAGAEQAISEDLRRGRQLFIAHKHQSFYDPLVLGAMFQHEKAFRPMRTKTVIPSKSSHFNHRVYGGFIRYTGSAVPFFRPQEFNDDDPTQNELIKLARQRANDPQLIIMQAHMNRGKHGVIYAEGTRAEDLLPILPGIGRIACGLDNPDNVSIVCIGTIFGEKDKDIWTPTSYVAYPFPVAETVDEVVSMTDHGLQRAMYRLTEPSSIMQSSA